MILILSDYFDPAEVGSKAVVLQKLLKLGLPVPAFVVVPNSIVQALRDEERNNGLLLQLQDEISTWRSGGSFAVRSAAFTEDANETAQAGKFLTEIQVSLAEVPAAIARIVKDAYDKLSATEGFSVIIQEYIVPDYAGVLFTRDPSGGREMVLEYVTGHGEKAVSGQAVSQVRCIGHVCTSNMAFLDQTKLLQYGREIEGLFGYPQDIEWAVVGERVSVLQSRPITSLRPSQWRGILLAEEVVRGRSDFFYERTVLSETFTSPTPLAFSVLLALHASGGPIDCVYRKNRIHYTDTGSISLLGREVYVDRNAEVRSLFPAYDWDFLKRSAKRVRWSGWLVSVLNRLRIARLPLSSTSSLSKEIKALLDLELKEEDDFSTRWDFFLQRYRAIFEINLKAAKALARAESLLTKPLSAQVFAKVVPNDLSIVGEDMLTGNSASMDDITPFVRVAGAGGGLHDTEIKQLLDSQLGWRAKAVLHHVLVARQWLELREEARWATVKLVSYLRRAVTKIGVEVCSSEPDLVWYASINELLTQNYSISTWRERKSKVNFADIEMPPYITSVAWVPTQGNDVTLSSGSAEGKLVSRPDLANLPDDGDYILVVEQLSPDLTQYFDRVKGIVTKDGGLLSHLAIMARERSLPVIQSKTTPPLGSVVRFDEKGVRVVS